MTQLQPSRCKPADYIRVIYAVTPEAGTPFEALLSEHYWAHVSMHFRPGCRIEVFPPEGNYYAELYVQDCGKLFARVSVLRKVDFEAVEVGSAELDLSAFQLKYCGPHANWCVMRLADKSAISKDHQSKDAAYAWLVQHVKTVGGPKKAAA